MTESRTYSVAGFLFILEAEASLFDWMQNLQPFYVHDSSVTVNSEIAFSIKTSTSVSPFQSDIARKATYSVNRGSDCPQTDIFFESDCVRFQFHVRPGKPVVAELVSDNDFTHGQLSLSGVSDVFSMNTSIKLMFTFATALSGALETHASVVVHNGTGYLFLGFSGTGKSTHSRLWLDTIPDTELLNDDFPVLRLMPDGSVRVFGSPWSGKTPCYKQESAPVGAIVWLRQGKENTIQRLSAVDAYAAMLSSTSAFRPIPRLADGWHKAVEGISTSVPFYILDCTPERSAAELCFRTINSQNNC